MKRLITILLIIGTKGSAKAQQEAHKGGSGDGYASVTYYKSSSIQINATTPPFVIKDKRIFNQSATTSCYITLIDVLGKQWYQHTIPPLSSISLPELVNTGYLLKLSIGEENYIRLIQQ